MQSRPPRLVTLLCATVLAVGASLAGGGCSNNDDTAPANGGDENVEGPQTNIPGQPTAEDIAALDAVQVQGAGVGTEPEVTFTTPFTVSAPTVRLVSPGEGASLQEGQQVTVDAVSFVGDGTRIFSTWDPHDPQSFTLGDPQFAVLTEPLIGANVGALVLVANPTQVDDESVTVLTLFEIVDARTIPSRAEGETVTPEPGLPEVTLGADGAPALTVPAGYVAPDELVVQTLIKGAGQVVTEAQTVTVHYTGWLLDGTVFDSSWERGNPATFPLSQVIPGWTQGLAGQTVGSQVLLVIPSDLAYGETGSGAIPPNAPLVFVVDILDAS